jgi:hypothetical protein
MGFLLCFERSEPVVSPSATCRVTPLSNVGTDASGGHQAAGGAAKIMELPLWQRHLGVKLALGSPSGEVATVAAGEHIGVRCEARSRFDKNEFKGIEHYRFA